MFNHDGDHLWAHAWPHDVTTHPQPVLFDIEAYPHRAWPGNMGFLLADYSPIQDDPAAWSRDAPWER